MKTQVLTGVTLVGLVGLIFLPRVLSLSEGWSSDETLWLERSLQFALACQERDLNRTLTSYHPGVTTTALGAVALWREYGSALEIAPKFIEKKFLSPARLAHARIFVAVTTGVTLLLSGVLLRHLFGNCVATVGTLFLAIDPFWLSESRRLHTDALATGFLLLSLLWWVCYLESEKQSQRNLIGAGISFGLACLSKSIAGGFLFFLPLLLAWYVKQRRLSVARLLWATLLWGIVSWMTVLLLWPALWTLHLGRVPMFLVLMGGGISGAVVAGRQHHKITHSPSEFQWSTRWGILAGLLLSGIAWMVLSVPRVVLEHLYWALTTPHEVPQLFLGEIRYAPNPLYYPVYWFVWGAPLTLPLVIYAMWHLWSHRSSEPRVFRAGVILVLFGVFYLLGLTLVAKKIARYLVISFPVWNLMAAIGAVTVLHHLSLLRRSIAYTVLAVLLFIQAFPVLVLHPHYSAYHHPLLSKKWIVENTSLGGGMGLDIAAAYLNRKQDAEQISVRITLFGRFFQYYFIGQTHVREPSLHLPTFSNQQPDYDIIYIRDKQVDGIPLDNPPINGLVMEPLPLTEEKTHKLEHVVSINGTNYAWIYRIRHKGNP